MGTHGREGEAIAVVADGDCIAFADSTGDDVAAQGRFDGMRDQAAQRTGTELRVEAFVGQFLQGFVGPGEVDLDLFFQTFAQAFQEDSGDIAYLVFLERFEDDDVVDTVEEFRTEVLFKQFTDFLVGFVVILRFEDFVGSRGYWS